MAPAHLAAPDNSAVPIYLNPDKNTRAMRGEIALKRLLALFLTEHEHFKTKLYGYKDQFSGPETYCSNCGGDPDGQCS